MHHSLRRVLILAIAAWVGAPYAARAQDVQYWNATYGTKALLLGGVVIGSSQDISAVYYNPAGLALLERTEVILSGTGYQYSRIAIDNGIGGGGSVSSSSISAVPVMFAGEIPVGFLDPGRLAYSVLTRQRFETRVQARGLGPDSTLDVPDMRFFSGDVKGEENLSDTWVGLTWARTANPHLSVGLTQFVSVRSQRALFSTVAQAIDSSGDAALAIRSRDFDYTTWGLLWKLGLAAKFPTWSMGMTVTTPSVHLFGSGSAGRDLTIVDQGISPNAITQVATDFQDGVAANYRTPLSVGVGGAYSFGPTRLHASAEWFASEAAYHVLETQQFTAQSSGQTMTNEVVQEFKAVVNYGVGMDHRFGPKLSAYGSFRTDRTPLPDSSAANATMSHFDLWHVTGGTSFSWLNADLVLGGEVAFGSRTPRMTISTIPIGDPGVPPGAKVSYTAATVFLAIKVAFGASH
jgi:hypothetical protein